MIDKNNHYSEKDLYPINNYSRPLDSYSDIIADSTISDEAARAYNNNESKILNKMYQTMNQCVIDYSTKLAKFFDNISGGVLITVIMRLVTDRKIHVQFLRELLTTLNGKSENIG